MQGNRRTGSDGTLDVSREGEACVVSLHGEHDASTSSLLSNAIDDCLDSARAIIVDLSDADFIDSTIIRILFARHATALDTPGRMFVMAVPLQTMPSRVLALMGGHTIPTYPSRVEALAAVEASA